MPSTHASASAHTPKSPKSPKSPRKKSPRSTASNASSLAAAAAAAAAATAAERPGSPSKRRPPLSAADAGRPGHAYELAPEMTRRFLGNGRFARLGVIGDGSCFYHSVCSVLDLDSYRDASRERQQEIAASFRCKFTTRLTQLEFASLAAGTATGKSYEATREALCSPRVWADEVMIKLASRVLNMNLVFLDLGAETLYCGVHGAETLAAHKRRVEASGSAPGSALGSAPGPAPGPAPGSTGLLEGLVPLQPTAVIVWVGREHFEPLVRVDAVDARTGAVTLTRVFEPRKSKADEAVVAALMSSYVAQCPGV